MRHVVHGGFLLAILASVLLIGAGGASARVRGRVFYLAVHPRQCLRVPEQGGGKSVLVVPCSDPTHNQEVYAVGHGGWGHEGPPAYGVALAKARSVCLAAFQRLTGRPMASNEGWSASWPDAGAESARYGDKIICKFRAWPKLRALGSRWHVH